MPRGTEWADVSHFADARAHADELMQNFESLGYSVREDLNGFSVALVISDQRLTEPEPRAVHGRQVAVYTTTATGDFRWGWVEHRAGDGRTDYDTLTEFTAALTRNHR